MKKIRTLLNEEFAKRAARFLTALCTVLLIVSLGGLALSVMGRQTFRLHSNEGTFDNAIYAEADHDWTVRGPTVSLNDDIFVTAGEEIDLITQVGLSALYLVTIVPFLISFWFLRKLCKNIGHGHIFTNQNADCLLYFGLIQFGAALIVPGLKLGLCALTNALSGDEMSVTIHDGMTGGLVVNIAVLVAAYIIRYGVHLQDEADHTL